jgi:hypothetical protein
MKRLTILALGISFLAAWLPASAHHGFATEYDRSKALTLVGKLTRVEMENPHGWLYIDAKDPQGKVVNWALELPGPAVLRRNGFDSSIYQTLMTSGEVVTVTAYAARDGSKHAFGGSLTRADGQTVIPLGRLPQGNRLGGNGGGYGRGQGQGPQQQQQQ